MRKNKKGIAVTDFFAPKTWKYLLSHGEALDGRRSSIYQNRPRFSVFGIGRYSLAPLGRASPRRPHVRLETRHEMDR